MSTTGVEVAIVHNGQILLTKREDFEVWCLPGGAIDAGETVAQTAVREAREETGIEVRLTRLVGIYSRPHWNYGGDHDILFAAEPVGGALEPQAGEVLAAGYFSPHKFPDPLVKWHRQRIFDALNGREGLVSRQQNAIWPFDQGMSRQRLYELRDQSGLSRQAFYLKYFDQYEPDGEALEIEKK